MSDSREVVSLVNVSTEQWPPRHRTYFGSLPIRTPEVGATFDSTPVRARRVEDTESYDGIDGLLSAAENNGQAIRSAFKLDKCVADQVSTNQPGAWFRLQKFTPSLRTDP